MQIGFTGSHGAQAWGDGGLADTAGDARTAVLPVLVAAVPRAGWWKQWHLAVPGLPLLLSPLEH